MLNRLHETLESIKEVCKRRIWIAKHLCCIINIHNAFLEKQTLVQRGMYTVKTNTKTPAKLVVDEKGNFLEAQDTCNDKKIVKLLVELTKQAPFEEDV